MIENAIRRIKEALNTIWISIAPSNSLRHDDSWGLPFSDCEIITSPLPNAEIGVEHWLTNPPRPVQYLVLVNGSPIAVLGHDEVEAAYKRFIEMRATSDAYHTKHGKYTDGKEWEENAKNRPPNSSDNNSA